MSQVLPVMIKCKFQEGVAKVTSSDHGFHSLLRVCSEVGISPEKPSKEFESSGLIVTIVFVDLTKYKKKMDEDDEEEEEEEEKKATEAASSGAYD